MQFAWNAVEFSRRFIQMDDRRFKLVRSFIFEIRLIILDLFFWNIFSLCFCAE